MPISRQIDYYNMQYNMLNINLKICQICNICKMVSYIHIWQYNTYA